MKNTIYLRHRRKVLVPAGDDELPASHLASALKNIEALGFTCAPALVAHLRTLSLDAFLTFYADVVPALRAMVGAHVPYRPFYPNFPAQVMDLDDAELYLNALIHYWTHARPDDPALERSDSGGRSDLQVIDLGDECDFRDIARQLLAAKVALSATDQADLSWLIGIYRADVQTLLPPTIPLKETIAVLAAALLRATDAAPQLLGPYIRTATDVLRLAVALSDGDVSLAALTKFRRFTRPERRLLLSLLEQTGPRLEDMRRHRGPWVRLGERLHPGEYRGRFPRSAAAFDAIRSNKPIATFNGRVEQALRDGAVAPATDLLATRPGELARRLDQLLRLAPADGGTVVATFARVADQVATPVLLQLLVHFRARPTLPPLRAFFPKGNVAKVQVRPNQLPPIAAAHCAALVALCAQTLRARFAALPPLGRVFVDARLEHYLVPFAQRSASKALRTLTRGSRLPIGAGSTIRFFLWWQEGIVDGQPTGRVDIDLSAVMYDATWRYVEHISYTNLRSSRYRAAHSGDITTAPRGACEFIDLDIDSVVAYGGRYVVMAINSYTEQPFCNLPTCFAGWMLRQSPRSGEIFEPRTVQDRVDLAADTRIGIPVILDLVAREVIWADLALRAHPRWYNNLEGNQRGMVALGQALTTLVRPTLYDLFTLHAEARGTSAPRADADTIFAVDDGITPFDSTTIMAEYM